MAQSIAPPSDHITLPTALTEDGTGFVETVVDLKYMTRVELQGLCEKYRLSRSGNKDQCKALLKALSKDRQQWWSFYRPDFQQRRGRANGKNAKQKHGWAKRAEKLLKGDPVEREGQPAGRKAGRLNIVAERSHDVRTAEERAKWHTWAEEQNSRDERRRQIAPQTQTQSQAQPDPEGMDVDGQDGASVSIAVRRLHRDLSRLKGTLDNRFSVLEDLINKVICPPTASARDAQPPPPPPTSVPPPAVQRESAAVEGEEAEGRLFEIDLGTQKLEFRLTDLPARPPAPTFARDFPGLLDQWENGSDLTIKGHRIPLKLWNDVYSRSGTQAWKALKVTWGNWRYLVEAIRSFPTLEDFRAKYTTDDGKAMTYQMILNSLKAKRIAKSIEMADAARARFGESLQHPYFEYTRTVKGTGGKETVKYTEDAKIAEKYQLILDEEARGEALDVDV